MSKILATAYKDFLLLIRDWGGLGILFLMPSVLIIVITSIQNNTFKIVGKTKMDVVLVDLDRSTIGQQIKFDLQKSDQINLVTKYESKTISDVMAKELVNRGNYQIAIVLPENLSVKMQNKIDQNVSGIIQELSEQEVQTKPQQITLSEIPKVKIYFDPTLSQTYRSFVHSSIDQIISQVEVNTIYTTFQNEMGIEKDLNFQKQNIIQFDEQIAQNGKDAVLPNAVQHNVPAWALFGIFFIVVPLSISLVKERNSGAYQRIMVSPVSYFVILSGKVFTYLCISLLQFTLMLIIGKFFFPYLGLMSFEVGHHLFEMYVLILCAAFAAIGLGILIGTYCKTPEQSAPLGAILVIIFAAIGGVWVPTFAMPEMMQKLAIISPMNWALESFYDIILRNRTFDYFVYKLLFLVLFGCACIFFSILYNSKKQNQ